jgi:tRNA(Ile)-lysidine synthase
MTAPGLPPRSRARIAVAPWLDGLPGVAALAAGARPVVAACSGGADSLALLALLSAAGADAWAVHVDHGLRPTGEREAEHVRRAAGGLGLGFRSARAAVSPGGNLEARARAARYEALEAARAALGADAIAVAHTADDQAETVLLNLLRGAAASGLGGMAPRRDAIHRPLLGLRRAATAEICARLGLEPVRDPMNSDARFRRVWLRREVVPALAAGSDRDIVAVLARQAAILRDESDLLDTLAADLLRDAGDPPRARVIAAAPRALARRAVRAWLGDPPPPFDAVEAVLAVAAGSTGAATLPGRRLVERAGGRLVTSLPGSDVAAEASMPSEAALALPGTAAGGGVEVDAWVETAPPVEWPDGRDACVVDADAVGADAVVRPVRPGDRFRPLGLGGSKRVTTALAEVGVPRSRRAASVVVVGGEAGPAAGRPIWLVGYGVDDRVRVRRSTRRYLWLTARRVASEPALGAPT